MLRNDAALIREQYLRRKLIGKGNVAVAEIHLKGSITLYRNTSFLGLAISPLIFSEVEVNDEVSIKQFCKQ
ncbi:MAG: hypothetical protein WBG70_07680 [Spirulinaceae cyanobacterium]